jgi:hypothetical protein
LATKYPNAPVTTITDGAGPDAEAQINVPRSAQTVVLLETVEGPTLVGAGEADLNAAQKALAEQEGLTVVDDLPEFHGEQTVIDFAGRKSFTPTLGVATDQPCGTRCQPLIIELGGWINGHYFGFTKP